MEGEQKQKLVKNVNRMILQTDVHSGRKEKNKAAGCGTERERERL